MERIFWLERRSVYLRNVGVWSRDKDIEREMEGGLNKDQGIRCRERKRERW